MLVYSCFEGDDIALAWRQHDAYGLALHAMTSFNRSYYLDACDIVGSDGGRWPADLGIDHRMIQDAHDLLAAAWRWRFSNPQAELPFAIDIERSKPIKHWLFWIADELETWRREPSLVRAFAEIVLNQNEAIGCAAERRLTRALRDRFSEVPWSKGLFD